MEDIDSCCNFCGSAGEPVWKEGKYKALECCNCNIVWITPTPGAEDMQNIYSQDYFSKYYLKYEKERKTYFRYRLTEIEQLVCGTEDSSSRLLDVGCGMGFFLEVAAERGWACEGVEISRFAADHAGDKGFKVYDHDLLGLNLQNAGYDLITMWDVIAHLPNPKGCIEKAGSLLRPGGLLVIKTPEHPLKLFRLASFISLFARSKGLLHAPAQIYHFTPTALSEILKRSGFDILKTEIVKEAVRADGFLSGFKDFLIFLSNIVLKLIGIRESFIIYVKRRI